jgi:peptide deformylase
MTERQNASPEIELDRLALIDSLENADILNIVAEEVEADEVGSPEVERVIEDMLWLAAGKDQEGGAQIVGLAAPQVGVSKRIVIIDINATGLREKQDMIVLINPEIVEMSDEIVDGRESCWSCGEYCANVPRARSITVVALDRDGTVVTETFEGFTARIIQHEIDHLDGIRCIDRVPVDQPWRLHLVNKANMDEFNDYRANWQTWSKTFPRSEWQQFHDGVKLDMKIVGEKAGDYQIFTAMRDDRVIGSVKVATSALHEPELAAAYPDTLTVYQLFTNPDSHGQGVGTRLMDVVEEVAAQQGASQILLNVMADNDIARKMYEVRGYECVTINDKSTVDSMWDVDEKREVVQVMPMIKRIRPIDRR